MKKKLSHIVLIFELLIISLVHTAKFYRDHKKTAFEPPASYQKRLVSVTHTFLQQP